VTHANSNLGAAAQTSVLIQSTTNVLSKRKRYYPKLAFLLFSRILIFSFSFFQCKTIVQNQPAILGSLNIFPRKLLAQVVDTSSQLNGNVKGDVVEYYTWTYFLFFFGYENREVIREKPSRDSRYVKPQIEKGYICVLNCTGKY
jgi:hypothetical protein